MDLDVDHHQVAHLQVLVLQQEQAGLALDAASLLARLWEVVKRDWQTGYFYMKNVLNWPPEPS